MINLRFGSVRTVATFGFSSRGIRFHIGESECMISDKKSQLRMDFFQKNDKICRRIIWETRVGGLADLPDPSNVATEKVRLVLFQMA